MKFRHVTAVLVSLTLCVGCASTRMGTEYNSSNVSQLKKGETTEQRVIQLIGEPYSRTRNSDGTVTLRYFYSPGETVHAFSMITNPGMIQNAGRGTKQLIVILDANSKVESFTESSQ